MLNELGAKMRLPTNNSPHFYVNTAQNMQIIRIRKNNVRTESLSISESQNINNNKHGMDEEQCLCEKTRV